MSGAKRRTKYRKHVEDMALNAVPEPKEGEQVVRVVQPAGGNLFEVTTGQGDKGLALLPTKFRNLIWVQRGHFLIVSASGEDYETAEGESGRVKFMVEHVLSKDQVRHLVERDLWPSGFRSLVDHRGHAMAARSAAGAAEGSGEHAGGGGDADSDSSGADDLLFHNRNRELPSDSSDDEGG